MNRILNKNIFHRTSVKSFKKGALNLLKRTWAIYPNIKNIFYPFTYSTQVLVTSVVEVKIVKWQLALK